MNAQNNLWHILLSLFVIWEATIAQAQSACDAALLVAEQKYRAGDFDGALDLINRCLGEKKVTKQNQASAYQLLGKVYIAQDDKEQAKKAFGKMLEVNPKITFDKIKETPEVMAIFNEVKTALEQKQRQVGKSRKWLWLGAGGLTAAGITAAIIFRGTSPNGPPESFVQPPGRPPR